MALRRSSRLAAVCAILAFGLFCVNLFVAPSSSGASPARAVAKSNLAGQTNEAVVAERDVAVNFFGEPEKPPPPKEPSFKLPAFFTTYLSMAVIFGGIAYMLSTQNAAV
eukprot:TRINITY_DN3462_c0_g1_i1.p2 TRINITY_DN3462_c0_g1~~TRINITY_DN3462_c0_g1_i1.p2  ORF type:complete len:109 (+),score=29.97 TRINITY_DN3462_c0_g1_i1:59-385(+)